MIQSSIRRTVLACLLSLAVPFLLDGCSRKAEAPRQETRAAVALELGTSDLIEARRVEFTRSIAVSGGLKAANSAIVKAKVAAEIESLNVREGNAVKAGQVIGKLDAREVRFKLAQAREQAAAAKAQLDIAQRALENNKALVDKGFISKNALDTSVSNQASALANLQAARAAVDLAQKALDDTSLRAPISGFVSQRQAQTGERVAVDARIVEIVDLSRVELEAALTPQDVASVKPGDRASLRVDGIALPIKATVARINPAAQGGSRSVMVYLVLDAHPALRQGLFATGQIDLDHRTTLAVPEALVRTDQATPYVLTVEASSANQPMRVAQRRVRLGERGRSGEDNVIEIIDGLKPGAQLLAASVGLVRDGTLVSVTASASPASGAARR